MPVPCSFMLLNILLRSFFSCVTFYFNVSPIICKRCTNTTPTLCTNTTPTLCTNSKTTSNQHHTNITINQCQKKFHHAKTASTPHRQPATISRCGMIYFEESVLGWRVIVKSWLATLPEPLSTDHADFIVTMFEWLVDPCMDFIRKHCNVCAWCHVIACLILS